MSCGHPDGRSWHGTCIRLSPGVPGVPGVPGRARASGPRCQDGRHRPVPRWVGPLLSARRWRGLELRGGGAMTFVERLARFQRSPPRAGLPIAVVYKFADDQGNYLAALITYYGFLSIFPLLLLSSTILNFVLEGEPGLQHRVLDSALGQLPVVGTQLADPHGVSGSGMGIVI